MMRVKGFYRVLPVLLAIILSFLGASVVYAETLAKNYTLDRSVLDRSLELGTKFLLNNQKMEGNFNYEYDWRKKEFSPGDSEVRQAGAAWGLALIFQETGNTNVLKGLEKVLAFFERNSRVNINGERFIIYPGAGEGRTGTVALCALAHIELLRSEKGILEEEKLDHYRQVLEGYLKFLVNSRDSRGLWHSLYSIPEGRPYGPSSPYFDGEGLLALTKAMKYLGREELLPLVRESADNCYLYNVKKALAKHPDSPVTKGFFQWGCMSYFELAEMDTEEFGKYGLWLMDLADWMIDVHKTLRRTRNTAYAYEGIIPAYQWAKTKGYQERAEKFRETIEMGLGKLSQWQVGSSVANDFIRRSQDTDPFAIGGVQNHSRESLLRVDVTQHQMHALILARRYVYTGSE